MTDRLIQFLKAENITQSEFADRIGVARASISHILSGRNKPGFDFIEGMARNFPALNIDWLITGKGRMYKTSEPSSPAPEPDNLFPVHDDVVPESPRTHEPEPVKTVSSTSSRVSRIIVFYEDGTYQELHG